LIEIPPKYLQLLQELLGEEFERFNVVSEGQPIDGLRANSLKITPQTLQAILGFPLEAVPWCPAGFTLPMESKTGKHPYHTAGLYYLQEPSAMAVAEILNPQPGERVLDLSAAPGGKATHLAALMQNRGFLLANEIHAQRAWELVENLERWGVRRTAVANETPERLAEVYGASFDRVLLDAPCSGEGMFRKSEAARRDWSPEFVRGCSLRQGEIIRQAGRLVRSGGYLLYSTCTFNPLENEAVIGRFLDKYPEFTVEAVPQRPGFQAGRPEWIDEVGINPQTRQQVKRAVRIWPHEAHGEGHFMALLKKSGEAGPTERPRAKKVAHPALPKAARQAFEEFYREFLAPEHELLESQELRLAGSHLYLVPKETQLPTRSQDLRWLRPGWWLGTFKGNVRSMNTRSSNTHPQFGRFEPSHALALGLQTWEVLSILDYAAKSVEVQAYLRGETLQSSGEDGWALVCVDGFPLGWGRRKAGVLKNFYPHSLRWG
jgi:NOL1/NOP2/sun family putative RNA methylase